MSDAGIAKLTAERIALELFGKGIVPSDSHAHAAKLIVEAHLAPILARNATLETELADAAKVLQAVLPIGQVKHIGLLEVAAGVQRLAEDNAAMEAVLRECRDIVQERHDAGAFLCEQFPSYRQEQENIAEAERMTQLLSRIDALTAKGAGQ